MPHKPPRKPPPKPPKPPRKQPKGPPMIENGEAKHGPLVRQFTSTRQPFGKMPYSRYKLRTLMPRQASPGFPPTLPGLPKLPGQEKRQPVIENGEAKHGPLVRKFKSTRQPKPTSGSRPTPTGPAPKRGRPKAGQQARPRSLPMPQPRGPKKRSYLV